MNFNTESSVEATMAAKASRGQDTLRLVFDPVPRAQVENTENSHTDVVVLDRGGQYDGIAIPIDIVAWIKDTDQKLASMQMALDTSCASMQQQALDIAFEQRASMQQVLDIASMQRELASMQQALDIALECPVCFSHRRNMRLQCGHLFCQACVAQVTTCPTCRQPVGASPPRCVFP
jgi:hypothetical protein